MGAWATAVHARLTTFSCTPTPTHSGLRSLSLSTLPQPVPALINNAAPPQAGGAAGAANPPAGAAAAAAAAAADGEPGGDLTDVVLGRQLLSMAARKLPHLRELQLQGRMEGTGAGGWLSALAPLSRLQALVLRCLPPYSAAAAGMRSGPQLELAWLPPALTRLELCHIALTTGNGSAPLLAPAAALVRLHAAVGAGAFAAPAATQAKSVLPKLVDLHLEDVGNVDVGTAVCFAHSSSLTRLVLVQQGVLPALSMAVIAATWPRLASLALTDRNRPPRRIPIGGGGAAALALLPPACISWADPEGLSALAALSNLHRLYLRIEQPLSGRAAAPSPRPTAVPAAAAAAVAGARPDAAAAAAGGRLTPADLCRLSGALRLRELVADLRQQRPVPDTYEGLCSLSCLGQLRLLEVSCTMEDDASLERRGGGGAGGGGGGVLAALLAGAAPAGGGAGGLPGLGMAVNGLAGAGAPPGIGGPGDGWGGVPAAGLPNAVPGMWAAIGMAAPALPGGNPGGGPNPGPAAGAMQALAALAVVINGPGGGGGAGAGAAAGGGAGGLPALAPPPLLPELPAVPAAAAAAEAVQAAAAAQEAAIGGAADGEDDVEGGMAGGEATDAASPAKLQRAIQGELRVAMPNTSVFVRLG